MWAQKARTNWFFHGDRNTRYFQTTARQRRSRNRITPIKDDHGHSTDNYEEIQIFLDSFKRSYSCNSNLTMESIIQEIHGLPVLKRQSFRWDPIKPLCLMAFLFSSFKNSRTLSKPMCLMLFKLSFTLVPNLRLLTTLSLLSSQNSLILKKCPILGLSVFGMWFTKLFQRFLSID